MTPEILLQAYRCGLFPMAESENDRDIIWIDPLTRGIIPLDGFHVPRSLVKTLRRKPFLVTINRAFDDVIAACGSARKETWINTKIKDWYCALHRLGHAHSIECWDNLGALCGGLYGVAINGAFFGESMFARRDDASKIALVHLVARLSARGFVLLDCQFVNPHLSRFGCIEIPREDYLSRLSVALSVTGVSFVSSFEIYSSTAASVSDAGSSAVLSCVSDWDSVLASLHSKTVTS